MLYYTLIVIGFVGLGTYSMYKKFESDRYKDMLDKEHDLRISQSPFHIAIREVLDEYILSSPDSLAPNELRNRRENLIFVIDEFCKFDKSSVRVFMNRYSEIKDEIEIIIGPDQFTINFKGTPFATIGLSYYSISNVFPPIKHAQ